MPTLGGPIPHLFTTSVTLGRSVQIASNLVCIRRGSCRYRFVLFVNFCFIHCMQRFCCAKLIHFPGRFARANYLGKPPFTASNSMYGEMFWRDRAGKCALILHSGISVTDRIQISELNIQ